MQNQQIKLIDFNGEKILVSTFIGANRDSDVLDYHKKIFNYYGIANNYFHVDFSYGYGNLINLLVAKTLNHVDYYLFFDMDAIPLKKDGVEFVLEKIKDKNTLWGISQQSNHIKKNGTVQHPYAGFSSCGFSKELYVKLGKPTFSETNRSDIGEELTWKCEELGYNVCLSYPTEFYELTDEEMRQSGNPKFWLVNNNIKYGLGTTFGGVYYHSFMATVPRSKELFIQKAKEVIEGSDKNKKVEAIIVCKNYSDYLELALPENKKYFDNVIVVTDFFDKKTQKVCEDNKIKCVFYDGFNKSGAKFNFGGARQFGLNNIKYHDWVCFIDSDIVIKEDFRNKLIDKNKVYGSYRRFIPTLKEYNVLNINRHALQNSYQKIEGSGCGFFQGIHCSLLKEFQDKFGRVGRVYPDSYSAEQVDIVFLRQFCYFDNTTNEYSNLERMNIELWHLGPHGTNNEGRSEKDIFFNK